MSKFESALAQDLNMQINPGARTKVFVVPQRRSTPSWQDGKKLQDSLQELPWTFWAYKKTIDIFFSLLLLPGLVFCMAILLVMNPFKNPGPIFFKQKRVGLNGLGAFMRDTRVDEVPQILNVLKGDMSMIGPRPEQVSLYETYTGVLPGFSLRQKAKPGITGLAQLKYGYTHDLNGAANKLRWDLIYLSQLGFGTETYLVVRTFSFVMKGLMRVFIRKLTFWRS